MQVPALRFRNQADGTAVLDVFGVIGGSWWADGITLGQVRDALADHDGDILVRINSPGGEVSVGVAIRNLLEERRRAGRRVTVDIIGNAHSSASVIAMAGDDIRITEAGQMLIHDAWGVEIGNAAAMREGAVRLDKVSDGVAAIYARRTGLTRDEARAVMLGEPDADGTWLSAEEAVEQGFADSILEDVAGDEIDAFAAFDWEAHIRAAHRTHFGDAGAMLPAVAAAARPPSPENSRMKTLKTADVAALFGAQWATAEEVMKGLESFAGRPTEDAYADVKAQRDAHAATVKALNSAEELRVLRKWANEGRFTTKESFGVQLDLDPDENGPNITATLMTEPPDESKSVALRFLRSAPGASLAERVAFVEEMRAIDADIARMDGELIDLPVGDRGGRSEDDSLKRIEARAQEIAGEGNKVLPSHFDRAVREASATDDNVRRFARRGA